MFSLFAYREDGCHVTVARVHPIDVSAWHARGHVSSPRHADFPIPETGAGATAYLTVHLRARERLKKVGRPLVHTALATHHGSERAEVARHSLRYSQ